MIDALLTIEREERGRESPLGLLVQNSPKPISKIAVDSRFIGM